MARRQPSKRKSKSSGEGQSTRQAVPNPVSQESTKPIDPRQQQLRREVLDVMNPFARDYFARDYV